MTGFECVEYTHGQLADVYRAAAPVTVLLWHGSGANDRGALAGLARAIAGPANVVVPDLRTSETSQAKEDLEASVDFSRGLGTRLIVAGWSHGGTAAAELACSPSAEISAFVGLAGNYSVRGPLTGESPIELVQRGRTPRSPAWLIHGTQDLVVPTAVSRAMEAALKEASSPVVMHELETDHAGVILASFVAEAGRCVPLSTVPPAQRGVIDVLRAAIDVSARATES